MFKITINLVGPHYAGLEALDKRRHLGLPYGTSLDVATRINSNYRRPECEVGETFARTWFGRKQVEASAEISLNDVHQSDIVLIGNQYAVTFADLSAERIQELFVMAKIKELRERVAYLETQLSPPETEEV